MHAQCLGCGGNPAGLPCKELYAFVFLTLKPSLLYLGTAETVFVLDAGTK